MLETPVFSIMLYARQSQSGYYNIAADPLYVSMFDRQT